MSKKRPEPGETYRHYKGGAYEVMHVGRSEADLVDTVVYRSLETGEVWTRPLSSWNSTPSHGVSRFKREKIARNVKFHVFLNGRPTELVVLNSDRRMKCGCLANADMVALEAEDALAKMGKLPEGHRFVLPWGNILCPYEEEPVHYGNEHVKLLPGGVGFVWVVTEPAPADYNQGRLRDD